MPRQPGAEPVVESGISATTARKVERTAEYSQQKYLTAMQERGATQRSQIGAQAQTQTAMIGAQSRERVAIAGQKSTQEIASLEREAADRRAGERIEGEEKTRLMMSEQHREKLEANQKQIDKQNEIDANILAGDTKRARDLRREADVIRKNNNNLDEWDTAAGAYVATEAGAAAVNNNETRATYMRDVRDAGRRYLDKAGLLDSVRQQARNVVGTAPEFTRITEKDFKEKLGIGGVRIWGEKGVKRMEEKVTREIRDGMLKAISVEVGLQSGNKVGLGITIVELAAGIANGSIGENFITGALVSLDEFRVELRAEVDVPVDIDEPGFDRAKYWALEEVLAKVDRRIMNISQLVAHFQKEKDPQSAKLVRTATNLMNKIEAGRVMSEVARPEFEDMQEALAGLAEYLSILKPPQPFIDDPNRPDLKLEYERRLKFKQGTLGQFMQQFRERTEQSRRPLEPVQPIQP